VATAEGAATSSMHHCQVAPSTFGSSSTTMVASSSAAISPSRYSRPHREQGVRTGLEVLIALVASWQVMIELSTSIANHIGRWNRQDAGDHMQAVQPVQPRHDQQPSYAAGCLGQRRSRAAKSMILRAPLPSCP